MQDCERMCIQILYIVHIQVQYKTLFPLFSSVNFITNIFVRTKLLNLWAGGVFRRVYMTIFFSCPFFFYSLPFIDFMDLLILTRNKFMRDATKASQKFCIKEKRRRSSKILERKSVSLKFNFARNPKYVRDDEFFPMLISHWRAKYNLLNLPNFFTKVQLEHFCRLMFVNFFCYHITIRFNLVEKMLTEIYLVDDHIADEVFHRPSLGQNLFQPMNHLAECHLSDFWLTHFLG